MWPHRKLLGCAHPSPLPMLVWATEFPLPRQTRLEDVHRLVEEWLRGSPYLPFANATFPAVREGETVSMNHAGHTLQFTRIDQPQDWWLAGRHLWTEAGEREWTTELVAHGSAAGVDIGVRLECNLLAPGLALPEPKKPYIMRMLLTTLGGGADSWITVDDSPTLLGESQVDDAASLLDGTSTMQLPVVYASALPNHQPFIHCGRLAQWLAGMAHVIVEPSRHFSFALARNTRWRNPYAGAVEIIWPRALGRRLRFLPQDYRSREEMAVDVAACIRRGLISARPTPQLTWEYAQELVAVRRLEALRTSGSAEVNDFAEAFDAEIRAKQSRIDEAEREIARLQGEVRRSQGISPLSGGVLEPGAEQEYYAGELRDALVFALGIALKSLDPDGRRRDLIDAVLVANPPSTTADDYAERIKRTFAASGDLTGNARRVLEDLGFEIVDEGRHYKAVFQGDGRYTFTISKTSSDHRAGKNLASVILRTLFK